MSGTNAEPDELRPELHQRIDRMDSQHLELLHRIILKLELEQVVGEVHNAFDAGRSEGRLDRVDEIIREVRARRPSG